MNCFDGAFLFDLKNEHGLPIEMALDRIIVHGIKCVDWCSFIDRAREVGWWDFQTYRVLSEALRDSDLSRPVQEAVLNGFKRYVMESMAWSSAISSDKR